MKKNLLLTGLLLVTQLFFSQIAVPSSGGNASGNGSSSYTVGQVFYTSSVSNSGSLVQGVQQSFEIFTLSNPDNKTLVLEAITFPNPTKDKIVLSIKNEELKNCFYELYDVKGQKILNNKILNDATTIDLERYAVGIYILKVRRNNQQLKTFKIIKN